MDRNGPCIYEPGLGYFVDREGRAIWWWYQDFVYAIRYRILLCSISHYE